MSNAISKNKDANRLKPNAEMAVVMVMMLLLLLLLVVLLLLLLVVVVVVVVNHQALDVLNVYFTYIHTNILYYMNHLTITR